MSSFTASLKDTLSDIASKASSNNTSPNASSSSNQGQQQPATQDPVRGLVGMISMYQSLSRSAGHGGSGDGDGGLLPVNLKSHRPGDGYEGVTPWEDTERNPMEDQGREEKSGCGCSDNTVTGSGTGTNKGKEACCANTGDCGNCKDYQESKDPGKYCQCRCKNQRSNSSGKSCGCQDQDNSNPQKEEYGGKSSFKDDSTPMGAGVDLGAGAVEYGSNNPLGQMDTTTTTSNVSHQFSRSGSGDFNPSPSTIMTATDELIAGAKNESENAGGRRTRGYIGSGALGGEFGGQD